jgi:hypothetical protein
MKLYSIWLRSNAPKKHRPKSAKESAADVLASLSDYREVETAADVLAAIRNDPSLLKESAEDVLAALGRDNYNGYVGQGMYGTTVRSSKRKTNNPFKDQNDEIVTTTIGEQAFADASDGAAIGAMAEANPDIPILFRCRVWNYKDKVEVPHHVTLTYLSGANIMLWSDPNLPPNSKHGDWFKIYSDLRRIYGRRFVRYDEYDQASWERIKGLATKYCPVDPDMGICTDYSEWFIPVIRPDKRFISFRY